MHGRTSISLLCLLEQVTWQAHVSNLHDMLHFAHLVVFSSHMPAPTAGSGLLKQ